MSAKPAQSKRTRLAPAARRAQLLDIGFEILLNEPLEDLTVDQVARVAGVSRGLVFHYFPTVRELHLACLTKAADDLVVRIAEASVAGGDRDERVRMGVDAFIAYIEDRAQTFVAMSATAASDPAFGEVFEVVRGQIVDLILDRGDLPSDPFAVLLFRSWVSFVEAAVVKWVDDRPVDRSELIATLVGVMHDVQRRWEAYAAVIT